MDTTTIELTVASKLAEDLLPYQHRLEEVLEAGLRAIQSSPNSMDEFWESLAHSGRVILPIPTNKPYIRHTPITLRGQLLSDIIIAQRGEL